MRHLAGPLPEARPFVVPCAALTPDAPWRWLRLGWHDVRRAPGLTASSGLLIVALSMPVAAFAWSLGRFALLAALLSGFFFVAPLIGVGRAAVFALCQLVIVLPWSRAGMTVTAFVPLEEGNARTVLEFLLVGSAVGSIFAAFTFSANCAGVRPDPIFCWKGRRRMRASWMRSTRTDATRSQVAVSMIGSASIAKPGLTPAPTAATFAGPMSTRPRPTWRCREPAAAGRHLTRSGRGR